MHNRVNRICPAPFSGAHVESAAARSLHLEFALPGESPKQVAGLDFGQITQFSGLATRDTAMCRDVLQNHRILANAVKAMRAHIPCRCAKPLIQRSAQMIHTAAPFPPCLYEPAFGQPLQHGSCMSFTPLGQPAHCGGIHPPFKLQMIECQ